MKRWIDMDNRQRLMKKKKCLYKGKMLLSISLILCLSLTLFYGCADRDKDTANDKQSNTKSAEYYLTDPSDVDSEHTLGGTKDEKTEQEAFDTWCNEEFIETMGNSDTLSLHYTLNNPESYGITEGEVSFGDFSAKQMKKDIEENAQCLLELSTFDYNLLTEKQQVTYEVLKFYLELCEESGDFIYYSTALSPDLGVAANVPVELAEYPLHAKENVETYLTLLTKLPDYFTQLAEYEQEVAKQGLFVSDSVLEDSLKQMKDFIAKPEENYLITTFAERLDNIEELSDEEREAFVKTNEENVKKYIIPAYEQLISDMTELKGSGKNQGGLCNFEKGKEYYEYLVKYYTCSDMTVEDAWDILMGRLDTLIERLSSLLTKDFELYDKYEKLDYGMTEPDEILTYLQKVMAEYYPDCPAVNYTVKHVDESLAESLSPAFFMVPQIDNYADNVIYINDKSSNFDANDLFPTLAHEGFPGHLFQTTYYNSTKPEPLRQILSFGGYSEGWATYVELSSYELVDFGDNDKEITDLCQIESELSLALSTLADIGINYKGWDKMQLQEFLDDYGMGDESVVNQLSTLVIEDPANYLQYYVSYLEFWNLRCMAKTELGDTFNSRDFHKVILDCGPSPFTVLEKQVKQYIKENK